MSPRSQENDNQDDEDRDCHLMEEETSLLLLRPSANSTTRPSLTNLVEYGSLVPPAEDASDEPLIQMHINHQGDDEGSPQVGYDAWPLSQRIKAKRQRCMVHSIFFIASLLLLISVGVFCFPQKEEPSSNNHEESQDSNPRSTTTHPLSLRDPVVDLKVKSFQRPTFSSPNPDLLGSKEDNHRPPLPTNAWYQNLLLARHEPTEEQRVYPMPYIMDVVGPIPGVRVHSPTLSASATVLQLTQVLGHGLSLGAASRRSILAGNDNHLSKKYRISEMTSLGITLEWGNTTSSELNPLTYSSSIVKGMPYATMKYQQQKKATKKEKNDEELVLPTIASETPIGGPPLLDGTTKLNCDDDNEPQWVQKEIELVFGEPDYTWLVFVSKPVKVRCIVPPPSTNPPVFVPGRPVPSPGIVFALQFLQDDQEDLVVRMALTNDCTKGINPITCGGSAHSPDNDPVAYANLLRQHADWYPGPNANVRFDFVGETKDSAGSTRMRFDWDVQSMSHGDRARNETELLMYALPHHQDMIKNSVQEAFSPEEMPPSFPTHSVNDPNDAGKEAMFCKTSLLGPACLVQGSTWNLYEDRDWETSFRAPRPPQNDALPALAKAYKQDLQFELPAYFQRGAGDTYFSGKMLAKLGRILSIGEELHEICNQGIEDSRPGECDGLEIPSPEDAVFLDALARLRSSAEIWINGTADTPFVYDDEWGGLVSCGCDFDEGSDSCRNQFPNCPAFYNPGMDFGNAYYNDHHFHLGYHIFAAAVVAHFDPQWGRDHFDKVLLLVRDIANPSSDDAFFPTFRNKDWYQGSSWASGIAVSPLNGRNQESSSEAIAAYEGVALFGMEMTKAWRDENNDNAKAAQEIQNYGEILMASEVRSADRYWHVFEASKRRQYPAEYTPLVVGILWNTMAQFQTWFGNAAYLAYGIQLLPLTPVSEKRDNTEWAKELYVPFAESCDAHFDGCSEGGWSVLVLAILATVGHRGEAIRKALELPTEAFTSAGGNGHSLTNTIWYLATRPEIDDPLRIDQKNEEGQKDRTATIENQMHKQSDNPSNDINGQPSNEPRPVVVVDPNFNCGCPETCDTKALDHFANGHSCRDRIVWLMAEKDHSEQDACRQVGLEFPFQCAACDPLECKERPSEKCPPCSKEICAGDINHCPIQTAPFLCTQGMSVGGCAQYPWQLDIGVCEGCCDVSLGCGDN